MRYFAMGALTQASKDYLGRLCSDAPQALIFNNTVWLNPLPLSLLNINNGPDTLALETVVPMGFVTGSTMYNTRTGLSEFSLRFSVREPDARLEGWELKRGDVLPSTHLAYTVIAVEPDRSQSLRYYLNQLVNTLNSDVVPLQADVTLYTESLWAQVERGYNPDVSNADLP